MEILQLLLAIVFLFIFGWIGFLNAQIAYKDFFLRQETASWVPLVAGVAGLAGLLLLPVQGLAKWCWVPLVLDWGSIPGLGNTFVYYMFLAKTPNNTQNTPRTGLGGWQG